MSNRQVCLARYMNCKFGVSASGSKGLVVAKNTVSGGATGIAVASHKGAANVASNSISDVSSNGVYVSATNAGKIRVSGNTVKRATKGAGVCIDKSANVEVSKNTLAGCKFGVSASASKGLTVAGNKVSGGNAGVSLASLKGSAAVKGNAISSVAGNGVYVNACAWRATARSQSRATR